MKFLQNIFSNIFCRSKMEDGKDGPSSIYFFNPPCWSFKILFKRSMLIFLGTLVGIKKKKRS